MKCIATKSKHCVYDAITIRKCFATAKHMFTVSKHVFLRGWKEKSDTRVLKKNNCILSTVFLRNKRRRRRPVTHCAASKTRRFPYLNAVAIQVDIRFSLCTLVHSECTAYTVYYTQLITSYRIRKRNPVFTTTMTKNYKLFPLCVCV